MQLLSGHVGSWVGTNGFRLMPHDELHDGEATGSIDLVAKGNAATIAYTWTHAEDGPQDGFVMIGIDGDNKATALWSDSWHQTTGPQVFEGGVHEDILIVSCTYSASWGWVIAVDARDATRLLLRMDNVVPESEATETVEAGPYPVMVMELQRA